jgi:hypothetical protein
MHGYSKYLIFLSGFCTDENYELLYLPHEKINVDVFVFPGTDARTDQRKSDQNFRW